MGRFLVQHCTTAGVQLTSNKPCLSLGASTAIDPFVPPPDACYVLQEHCITSDEALVIDEYSKPSVVILGAGYIAVGADWQGQLPG